MKWLKNPFLLGAQGFLAGAIMFAATNPEFVEQHLDTESPPAAETRAAAVR